MKTINVGTVNILFKTLLSDADVELEKDLTYQQWDSTDKMTMKTMVESLENFVDDLCEKVGKLTAHSYTAKSQAAFLKQRKEDLPSNTAI